MESNYNIEIKDEFIHLKLSGKYDLNLFLSYGKKVQETCNETKIKKLLVDSLNVEENDITAKERQFIGINIASDSKHHLKIASVWSSDDYLKFINSNDIEIDENYRIFSDFKTAETWLLSK